MFEIVCVFLGATGATLLVVCFALLLDDLKKNTFK